MTSATETATKLLKPVHDIEGGEVVKDSPASIRSFNDGGNQLIQMEHGVTRNFIVVMWLSCLISAAALVGLVANYSAMKTLSAQYEVLQYDHQALKAQLVARGIYEGTEH